MISEGLNSEDLAGILSPKFGINLFDSKIDDDAFVISFYVQYQDAAADLNAFIQRCNLNIIDTEVSSAPDETGSYVVFVELYNDASVITVLQNIIRDVSNLTGYEGWQYTFYGEDVVRNFTEANLLTSFRGRIVEGFFKNAISEYIFSNKNFILLKNKNNRIKLNVLEVFYPHQTSPLLEEASSALVYNATSLLETNTLSGFLGGDYVVERYQDYFLIEHCNIIIKAMLV